MSSPHKNAYPHTPVHEKEKKRKTTQAAKKLLTSIKEKGPLGKKSPLTRKEESSQ